MGERQNTLTYTYGYIREHKLEAWADEVSHVLPISDEGQNPQSWFCAKMYSKVCLNLIFGFICPS